MRGIAIATEQPCTFHGNYPIITVSDISKFGLEADQGSVGGMVTQQFDSMYSDAPVSLLRHTGKESMEAMRLLSSQNIDSYKSEKNVEYPKSFQLASGQSQRWINEVQSDVGF